MPIELLLKNLIGEFKPDFAEAVAMFPQRVHEKIYHRLSIVILRKIAGDDDPMPERAEIARI